MIVLIKSDPDYDSRGLLAKADMAWKVGSVKLDVYDTWGSLIFSTQKGKREKPNLTIVVWLSDREHLEGT